MGRINYREFVKNLYAPNEMKRRKMMETNQNYKNEGELIPKKQKRKYNLAYTGFRQKIEHNLDDNQKLINKLKEEILSQGPNILFNIQKTLLRIDVDKTGYIDLDDFSRLLYEYNINLIPNEIKIVFSCFDPSRTGKMFYKDFINIIHGSLEEERQKSVDDLYVKLTEKKLPLDIRTILYSFNEQNTGKESAEEFKDNFLIHHEFFGKDNKNLISYDEFLQFFENLSVNFPDDDSFKQFLDASFGSKDNENNENETEQENNAKEFLDSLSKLRNIIISQ